MTLYMILVSLTAIGGFITSYQGWKRYQTTKKSNQWPSVTGTIIASEPAQTLEELPVIIFSYEIGDEQFQRQFDFPSNDAPLPELAQSYSKKYPLGKEVTVFFQPDTPDQGVLEHDDQGDWIVLGLGILISIIAIGALIRPM